MANFNPPPDFHYDSNSGLYYKTAQGLDPATQKRGQMVTWFYPQTGQRVQEFYPVEEAVKPEPVAVVRNEKTGSSLSRLRNFPWGAVLFFAILLLVIGAVIYAVSFVREHGGMDNAIAVLDDKLEEWQDNRADNRVQNDEPTAFDNFMDRWFGNLSGFGLFLPLLIIIAVSFIFYKLILKRYRDYLLENYGFKLFLNIPGLLVMIFYGFASSAGIVSASATGLDDFGRILLIIAVGAPGMLIYAINCYLKTRNILITLVNIPLMYFIYFLVGYTVGLIIMMVVAVAASAFIGISAMGDGVKETERKERIRKAREERGGYY